MDFTMSDERRMVRDMVSRFLSDQDDKQQPAVVYSGLADLGVLAALFTEDQGGMGGTGYDLVAIFEELGRAGRPNPLLSIVPAGQLIARSDHPDRNALVEEMISGDLIVALAHSEPDSRYDFGRVDATAKHQGDTVVLNGQKTNIAWGDQAQRFIVSARLDDKIELYLVPADTAGLTRESYKMIDGSGGANVTLVDVQLPASSRLALSEDALLVLEQATAFGIVALSAQALGAMKAAKALTLDYMRQRKQFGTTIGSFQALQHRMVDLAVEVEQVRSSVINLAGHIGGSRPQRQHYVSAAKCLIGRVAHLVAEETIQMHGAIGLTQEYELSRFVFLLVAYDHIYGDSDYHLEQFVKWTSR